MSSSSTANGAGLELSLLQYCLFKVVCRLISAKAGGAYGKAIAEEFRREMPQLYTDMPLVYAYLKRFEKDGFLTKQEVRLNTQTRKRFVQVYALTEDGSIALQRADKQYAVIHHTLGKLLSEPIPRSST